MEQALHGEVTGQLPNMVHAGAYSAVLHYLRSVASAGTIDASVVVARMKQMPVNDFNNQDVRGRQDGVCFTPCISSA
jgi:branched-chain amino acid transport system substrate-binding protein